MSRIRTIRKLFKSKPTLEGAGVHLKRAFGFSQVPMFDPFLLLDDFRSDNPDHYSRGFPWHPHRGIETITYVLRGDVEHEDSLGNKGMITSGDVQWMTAGSGVIHQEMPKGDRIGVMWGFQLWANLPASHKMMDPRYREVKSQQVPRLAMENGVSVQIIAGQVAGVEGPVRDIVIDPEYLDISVPPGTTYTHSTEAGHTVLAYVLDGEGCFCRQDDPFAYEAEGVNYFDMQRDSCVGDETLLLFGDGEEVTVRSDDKPIRFLLISGKPIGEPIAWYGPIVMNTHQQLQVAFEEYRAGTFVKHRAP
jgi:redox-sensitive bicupin YhaK (pirin superfamily)